MDQKINKNREKKEVFVTELSGKLSKSKGLVFTNYQGLGHKQLEQLRKVLRPLNAEFIITKNTLLQLALNKEKLVSDETLKGPTGVVVMYNDFIEPLKQLTKVIKDFGFLSVKFGFFEGKPLPAEDVIKFASLPPYEVLISNLLGSLKSPIYGLHRALSWDLQKLVLTLKAIEQKKQKN
jgi:large subunit ribosomal protein L10